MVIISQLKPLELLLYLVLLINRLVAAFIQPLFEHENWDRFWLMYIAWILGGVLVFLTDINLFAGTFHKELVGQLLTAVCVGGGANILYDITDIQGSMSASLRNARGLKNPDASDR